MTALSRGIALLFFLAEASSLLQVHTRLAGAILKQALHEAQREKEAYLAEADRLIAKAKEIDEMVDRVTRKSSFRAQILQILDFDNDRPILGPLENFSFDDLFVLAWEADEDEGGIKTRVAVGERGNAGGDDETLLSVLALPATGGGRDVLVSLTSETQARQIAHVMSQLEDFPLKALRMSVEEIAPIVTANDLTLGVILEKE